ncbi:reverse transcriptase domain-containing protein [Tanacetum coccineum]
MQGIKAFPEKTEALMKLQSPQTLKEAQSLNRKLASLNRFLSKSAEKSLPFFKIFKRCIKKSDFQWTTEAEKAFQNMKKCIAKLPMVIPPKPKEELIMYLCPAREAVRGGLRIFNGALHKINDMATRVMLPCYIGHLCGFAPGGSKRSTTSGKRLAVADFIAEKLDEEGPSMKVQVEETVLKPWVLFMDGSSCLEGSGAGLILTSPEGEEFTYALRFEFDVSNNEAEYEALVADLRIAEQMGVKNLTAKVDSHLVANQINGLHEAKEQSMTRCVKQNHVHKLCSPHQASLGRNTQKKINRGEGNPSSSGRRRVLLDDTADRIPYGRPTTVPRNLQQKLTSITSPWPFYKWGIDISCPFPKGQRKVKFLIIAIDYFTKWVEAKPDWCEKLNIKQRFASGKHPQTNGQVERANRNLGEGIKARLGEDNRNWVKEMSHVLWAHRTMIKTSNGDTSFSLTYGTEAVIPVEIGMPSIRWAEVNQAENDEELLLNLDILEERREKEAVREAINKAKMAKYYNAKVRSTSFRPRDFIYRSNEASRAKKSGKLGPKWEGPYKVLEALGKGSYKLRNGSGDILPRT